MITGPGSPVATNYRDKGQRTDRLQSHWADNVAPIEVQEHSTGWLGDRIITDHESEHKAGQNCRGPSRPIKMSDGNIQGIAVVYLPNGDYATKKKTRCFWNEVNTRMVALFFLLFCLVYYLSRPLENGGVVGSLICQVPS